MFLKLTSMKTTKFVELVARQIMWTFKFIKQCKMETRAQLPALILILGMLKMFYFFSKKFFSSELHFFYSNKGNKHHFCFQSNQKLLMQINRF